jgi:hypothetical protein
VSRELPHAGRTQGTEPDRVPVGTLQVSSMLCPYSVTPLEFAKKLEVGGVRFEAIDFFPPTSNDMV